MAEAPEIRAVPRSVVAVTLLTLLAIGVIAYMAPAVISPMFLGILLFAVLVIYLVTDFLVRRGLLPSEYIYFMPIFILGLAFILAGLAERGYLPAAAVTGNALADLISTTMMYAIIIAALVGVIGFLAWYIYVRPRWPRRE